MKDKILKKLQEATGSWREEQNYWTGPGQCDDRAFGAGIMVLHLENAAALVSAAASVPAEGDKEGWKAFFVAGGLRGYALEDPIRTLFGEP